MLGVALVGCTSAVAAAPRVVVPISRAAAEQAVISGGTPRERAAVRAALAPAGNLAAKLRVSFSHPGSLTVVTPASDARVATMSATFLGRLVAVDATDRLLRADEHVSWRVLPAQTHGSAARSTSSTLAELEHATDVIAARARAAGWRLAPTRIYRAGGGGLVVTVRLGDRELLESRDTAFASTLIGQSRGALGSNVLLVIEGPGNVFVGGGSAGTSWSYGGSDEPAVAAPVPSRLAHAPIRLQLEFHRRAPAPTRVELRCGIGAPQARRRLCAALLRERAVLFSPVQSDVECAGMPTDEMTLHGTVDGVRVERTYSNCYAGVTYAWEHLLGLRRR